MQSRGLGDGTPATPGSEQHRMCIIYRVDAQRTKGASRLDPNIFSYALGGQPWQYTGRGKLGWR